MTNPKEGYHPPFDGASREAYPWRLVSLWEFMKQIDIEAYFTIGGLITGSAEMARNQPADRLIAEENVKFFLNNLDILEQIAKPHSLKRTATNVGQAKEYFTLYKEYPGKPCFGDVHMLFNSVSIAARDDLKEMFVAYVGREKAEFFNNPTKILSENVLKKFPPCFDDILEAGNCYAADRNTGCVFHLMRVMEYGVRRFAKKLKVPLIKLSITRLHEYSWHEILDLMNPELAKIDQTTLAGKAKHQKYSAVQAELYRVKDAWRNPTMHPSAKPYNSLEALNILNHVSSFMSGLAGVV